MTEANLQVDSQVPASAGTSGDDGNNEQDIVNGDPRGLKRERWATPIDFVLACVGYSIGYGNVWRFPYLVYRNGGGAFLIPFFLSALLGSIPIFFLEVIHGQFMSAGVIKAWKIAPLFEGIGFASCVIVFFLNCYYNILLAWSLRYFFASFNWVLPWQTCQNEWNTEFCEEGKPMSVDDSNYTNVTHFVYRSTHNTSVASLAQLTDPAMEYWERGVLDISDGIEQVGVINWRLLLCHIGAWLIVFGCIYKGIRSSGRVMYFTATVPFLLMIILAVRGMMLPGAMNGLKFYLQPDFTKLREPRVWADAGTQVFFSYSLSVGVLHAFGSYNPWRQNTFRDSFIFSCVDSFACLLSGFVIFPMLGYMAWMKDVAVSDVAGQGPGLVFVVYPKAVSMMPLAPVWSALFFAMLLLVGIDSQFCSIEGCAAAIIDFFPKKLAGTDLRRAGFLGLICIIKFLIGLSMITRGGMYVFQILDYYSGCRIIMLVSMTECLVIGWVYGAERFCKNMEMMWGRPLWPPFRVAVIVMWKYVTPLYVFCQFVLNSILYSEELVYVRNPTTTYYFPKWAIVIGWFIAYSSIIFIPLVAIVKLCQCNEMSFLERLKYLTKPILKPYMVIPNAPEDSYILEKLDTDQNDEDNKKSEEQAGALLLEDHDKTNPTEASC